LDGCPELPLTRFGPKLLLQIQERLVEKGLCRDTVNQHVKGIRRIVRWAVSQEMAPGEVLYALQSVRGLRRGKTTAPDYPPVQPIDDLTVEKTLPFCGRIVAAMIRFEKLTGCRPGEVCSLRPCDVDQSGEIWEYRPAHHKTMHLGRERVILIGPKAQAVLMPFLLLRPPKEFCFSAEEAVKDWRAG
jgi:integrase